MSMIHISMLGRFAVTVDDVPSRTAAGRAATPPRSSRCSPWPPVAAAPRADHRSPVARRHDRRGGAQAAQGRALRTARHRRTELGGAARRQRRAAAPTPTLTVDVVEFEELARHALGERRRGGPPKRSRSTAVSCCRRTATRRGPRSVASSCGSAISTCCASTAAGRRWSSSTRATSSPISRSCDGTRRTATATRRSASSSAWIARLRRELGVAPGREAIALRDRLLAEHDVVAARDDALIGRDSGAARSSSTRCSTPPPATAAR